MTPYPKSKELEDVLKIPCEDCGLVIEVNVTGLQTSAEVNAAIEDELGANDWTFGDGLIVCPECSEDYRG